MFHTIFYVPLYNVLIGLTTLFQGSFGWAIIGMTLLVKIVLTPLSYQSTISQMEQKKLLPFINEIKKKYPDQKEQALKLNELYKEHKTHPLSGCLLLLIQLPILFGIFFVVKNGAAIVPADLYSFITAPASISTMLFGMDIAKPSIILLILAGVTQFLQMHFSPALRDTTTPDPTDTQAVVAANMQKTMKYIIPVMIVAGGWSLPGAIMLYWIISSVFMMTQEQLTMRMLAAKKVTI